MDDDDDSGGSGDWEFRGDECTCHHLNEQHTVGGCGEDDCDCGAYWYEL